MGVIIEIRSGNSTFVILLWFLSLVMKGLPSLVAEDYMVRARETYHHA